MRVSPSTLRATSAALALSVSTLFFALPVHAGDTKPASPTSSAERQFLSQVGLEKVLLIEYRDVKGAIISFAQFQKLQPAFPNFSMMKTKKGNLTFAMIALEAAAAKPATPAYKLKPGAAFPAFKLAATDNTVVDSATLRGKYTVINFYFADCAPCVKEVPMLNAFAAKHKDITVLAFTFDSVKDTRAFAKRTHFGWRTFSSARKLIDQVGVKGYPSFALLDAKGVIVALGDQGDIGGQDGSLDKWVAKMMAAKPI